MAERGQRWVNRVWYDGSLWSIVLLPLSGLFAITVAVRRWLYRRKILSSTGPGVPVVVVGNLTVGGTGKTPVVVWLVDQLARRGLRVGVASRGYAGDPGTEPVLVDPQSDAATVGDEPLLIARRCKCPVAVHPDRVAAARTVALQGVDLIVADDALQHYRLASDLRIVVVDGMRGFGNGHLLPAGPLREPRSRLTEVDWLLHNGEASTPVTDRLVPADRQLTFVLRALCFCRLSDGVEQSVSEWRGRRVHAVAAIGNPARFFVTLRELGLTVREYAVRDHAVVNPADIAEDGDPVVMTEKDAVKFPAGSAHDAWYLKVAVDTQQDAGRLLDEIAALVMKPAT